ncbi:MAG TPA: carboxypeptidase-like regulatory domain-containing protein, partial [Tepidisphaeraceae bacterium]|nr:carboxypeptidase-like regulatory domain-containing protein [Tepidisphaeraceae bacterium]
VRLQAAIDALPQEMDAADALKMLADVALFHLPRSQSAFADATVAESRTDSTGKYELKNVAPGDYYLHATQARPSSFIEWCVPVRVEAIGHTVRLDLNRENAAVNVRIAN